MTKLPEPGTEIIAETFNDADFSRQDLSGCCFRECHFVGTNLRSANLTDCEFDRCHFNDTASENPADFSHARLREAYFSRCNLTVVDLTHCSGYAVRFENCQMQGADLSQSDFRIPVGTTDLAQLTIAHCNLSFANLSNNFLHGCELSDSRLLECCLDYCDLSEANLSGSELHNIVATGLTLKGADLRGATFNNLDPTRIDMRDVRLYYSQLVYVVEPLGLQIDADP